MIQAFFFDLQAVQRGDSRPKGVAKSRPTKVGIVGAGMMGAGIAYVTAKAGIDVVLKDVTHDAALKGRAYGEGREAGEGGIAPGGHYRHVAGGRFHCAARYRRVKHQ